MSTEELNQVPAGFNNNLVWNLAHLVVAQENIFYAKAGLPINLEQDFFNAYLPGTKPERALSAQEIEDVKVLLFSSVDKLEKDLTDHVFTDYAGWTTRYGVEMNSVEDALTLLPFHDGLHFGYMMAQKRVLRS